MKSLDDLVGRIEKRFGKEAVVKSENSDIEKVSSGSLAIDKALGGGFVMGRIHEVFGSESSGKCLKKNSYVLTTEGYKTVEQIFRENGLEPYCLRKVVEKAYPLINYKGEIELTKSFTFNGRKPIIKIKTMSGFVHETTAKHPLLVMIQGGCVAWKWASEIKEGDILIGLRKQQFGTNEIESDRAYLIGCLMADGTLSDKSKMVFTNNDPDIKNFIESLNYPIYGLSSYRKYSGRNGHGCFDYQFTCISSWNETRKELYVDISKAGTKEINSYLMSCNKETIKNLLQGYFDCEGYFDATHIEVTSKSRKLLYQVKLLLSQFGIKSTLDDGMFVGDYSDLYYRLSIYSEDYDLYIQEIGTRSEYRKCQMNKTKAVKRKACFPVEMNDLIKALFYSNSQRRQCFVSIKQNIDLNIGASKGNVRELIDFIKDNNQIRDIADYLEPYFNYTFDKVKSVEYGESEPTFDFEMTETHTFIADGCINHNTSLALHLCTNIQKDKGKAVGYVDTEQSLDLDYAKNIGLDISSNAFILSQPDSAEQAMEIVREMLECEDIGIVVLDSVAGLVPQAVLQGESGDQKIGLVARLMSAQLSILKNVCKKNNNILLCINQVRDKIGAMGFGGPSTMTPGGRALKFYATQRLETARIGTDKNGDVAVANKTKVKIVKNKVAPPFRTCEVMLRFGIGFDIIQETVELAVELGICKKKGSWYYYGDDYRIGQGMDNVREVLSTDKELFNEIYNTVKQAICTPQD